MGGGGLPESALTALLAQLTGAVAGAALALAPDLLSRDEAAAAGEGGGEGGGPVVSEAALPHFLQQVLEGSVSGTRPDGQLAVGTARATAEGAVTVSWGSALPSGGAAGGAVAGPPTDPEQEEHSAGAVRLSLLQMAADENGLQSIEQSRLANLASAGARPHRSIEEIESVEQAIVSGRSPAYRDHLASMASIPAVTPDPAAPPPPTAATAAAAGGRVLEALEGMRSKAARLLSVSLASRTGDPSRGTSEEGGSELLGSLAAVRADSGAATGLWRFRSDQWRSDQANARHCRCCHFSRRRSTLTDRAVFALRRVSVLF